MRLYVRTSRNTGVGLGFWTLFFGWPLLLMGVLVYLLVLGLFWLYYGMGKGVALLIVATDRAIWRANQRRRVQGSRPPHPTYPPPNPMSPRPPTEPKRPAAKVSGHAWG